MQRIRSAACGLALAAALLPATIGMAAAAADEQAPAASGSEADSTEAAPRAGWSVAVIPAFFRTPDTGFGGGGGVILTHRPDRGGPHDPESRPNTIPLLLIYTERKQTIALVAPEIYFGNEAWRLGATLGYGNFPSTIYGIGNDTPEEAEEDFTIEYGLFAPTLIRRVVTSFHAGLTANLMKVAVLEREPGGIYDRMIAAGRERGWRSGVGPLLEWDTRDHLFAPSRGTWIQLRALYYRDWMGSDFDFEERALDVRHYLTLAPRHILAGQALAVRFSGQIPLSDYPSLGSDLRGVLDGRYNDRALLMGQIEYRYPLWRRLGGVLFAGLGDVNDRLGHMAAREMKFAAGAGLRFMIDPGERLSVRMDIGFSREGSQFYLQFSEAF